MSRHNWEQIKKEYVEGIEQDGQLIYPTQKSIADKYGIAPETVNRKAKADQWEVQREIFVNKTSIKRQEKKAELISDEGSQFDLDCFNAAQAGIEKAFRNIGSCYLIEDLSKLSTAIKNFQAVGKASLGDKTVDGKIMLVVDDP